MAFWGIEVKPGKHYTHRFDSEGGRLHLSQATLGNGSSKKKSFLQCKTGDNQPIYLCSLLPDKIETCALNLEFDEEDEVVFSVEGPHSVHLSGFFLNDSEDVIGDAYESDSFGEEISGTDSDDASVYDSEDMDLYPSSAVPKSGVVIEEILDGDKSVNDNGSSKHGKKKKQLTAFDKNNPKRQPVAKSNVGDHILESEDEDGFPIPSNHKNKSNFSSSKVKPTEVKKDQKSDKEAKKKKRSEESSLRTLKRKAEALLKDKEEKSESGPQSGSSPADIVVSETDMKQKKKKKKRKTEKKEEPMQLGDESLQNQSTGKNLDIDAGLMGEEENKKEKNKKQGNGVVATADQGVVDKKGSPQEKTKGKPIQVRTFPNGLVIEEMSMGKPDGKKASPGKKVSVNYIGKLKDNGEIFDSNVGKAPFMFRLGVGQVIKGWDCGVNGMRVGDKRRLTIPPAMGYGSEGAGQKIQPNSWLVFDVELVAVN